MNGTNRNGKSPTWEWLARMLLLAMGAIIMTIASLAWKQSIDNGTKQVDTAKEVAVLQTKLDEYVRFQERQNEEFRQTITEMVGRYNQGINAMRYELGLKYHEPVQPRGRDTRRNFDRMDLYREPEERTGPVIDRDDR